MSLIDDIARDREAGTSGPIVASAEYTFRAFKAGFTLRVDTTRQRRHADANRIARIADMEAALIAAEELAARVQQQQDGWPMRTDYITDALAAYRKATGAGQ